MAMTRGRSDAALETTGKGHDAWNAHFGQSRVNSCQAHLDQRCLAGRPSVDARTAMPALLDRWWSATSSTLQRTETFARTRKRRGSKPPQAPAACGRRS